MTSARGLDVTFVAQYNDRIIYDCITSVVQKPIRFPLPKDKNEEKEWRKTDSDYLKKDDDDEPIEFEDFDVFKGATMVRQPMIMDDKGAIYFMIKTANQVKVLRTDPLVEMGQNGFIKSVFTLRASRVFFLLYREGLFYLMDEAKKIRVLKPNDETYHWV